MPKISFSEKAFDDYLEWQNTDKATFKKINRMISEIIRTPFKGIGKPEPLKNDDLHQWSRRINKKDRIVYVATDEEILITQCKDHYDD